METGEESPTVRWGLAVGLSKRADVRADTGWCLRVRVGVKPPD